MNDFSKIMLAFAISLAFALPALAGDRDGHREAAPVTAANIAMAEGVVKSVDKQAGQLTIRHGPIPNLGMGAMTMPFRVKDPALLERIKTGDKIKFAIENEDGKLMIVDIVPATRGGTKGNTAGGRR